MRLRLTIQSSVAASTSPAQAAAASTTKSESARVASRSPELQYFHRAGQCDGAKRGHQPVLTVGKAEGEPDQDKSQRMLAVLAEIGVRAVTRRAERRKGNSGGEAPGNQSKKGRHGVWITRMDREYSASAKCRSSWLMPMLKAAVARRSMHEVFPYLHGIAPRGVGCAAAGGIVNMPPRTVGLRAAAGAIIADACDKAATRIAGKRPGQCRSTTSASSTSNISPTTSTSKSSRIGPTCGSTGSRTRARPRSLRPFWRTPTPTRSVRRAMSWRGISMPTRTC